MPSRYRDDLQALCAGRFTVTKHPHGCLMVFPHPTWEKFRDQLANSQFAMVEAKRMFLGSADDVEWDATSRLLIRPELRAFAGLVEDKRDVMLVGMASHFELWHAPVHAAREAASRDQAAAALANMVF